MIEGDAGLVGLTSGAMYDIDTCVSDAHHAIAM